jgi:monothiol glutaredoxin
MNVQTQLADLIAQHKVLLFMKGSKSFPQCGFSSRLVEVLKREGVPFETVNVLADPAIRQGIKELSNWPTIPQLYVDGKFLGGCDIVTEMHASGELTKELAPFKSA